MRKSRFSEEQSVAILEVFRACSSQLGATTRSTDWIGVKSRMVGQLILGRGPHRYTPSILRMIRSVHWTALAINDSVLELGRDSCRSSGFFRCRATKIAAAMAKTRFRPSSMWIVLAYSLFVRNSVLGRAPSI